MSLETEIIEMIAFLI